MSFLKPDIEKLKAKKNVEKLIKAGKHPDPAIRKEAIRALGELGDKRAVEPLIQALKDEDLDIQMRATEALGEIGDERALEPIMKILKYPRPYYSKANEKNRANAALALGKFCKSGDERAVEFFLQALKDNTHLDIRKTAVEALGRIEDKRAVKLLIRALQDENSSVRTVVARILDQLAWKPEDVLERAFYLLAKGDRLLFKEMGELAVPGFLQILTSDCHLSIRMLAARVLGAGGDKRAVEPLIKALKDEEIDIRRTAVYALGGMGDDRAVEPLIQALKDEKVDIRRTAVYALGGMGDDRAVEPLIQALKDEDIDIRKTAAKALGELGDKRAVNPLIQALKDKDTALQEYAATALGKIGDDRAAEPLMRVLKDKDTGMESAAEALGKIGDRKYAEGLIDYLFANPNCNSFKSKDYFAKKAAPYENTFRDYAELILRITSFESSSYKRTTLLTWFTNGIEEALGAVKELGNIDSPISGNILHKIAGMNDIKVIEEISDNDETYTSETRYGKLSVELLREKAREELGKRGNPPYDPSAYLTEKEWKI